MITGMDDPRPVSHDNPSIAGLWILAVVALVAGVVLLLLVDIESRITLLGGPLVIGGLVAVVGALVVKALAWRP